MAGCLLRIADDGPNAAQHLTLNFERVRGITQYKEGAAKGQGRVSESKSIHEGGHSVIHFIAYPLGQSLQFPESGFCLPRVNLPYCLSLGVK
jgi:hypothetical protein